MCSNESMGAFEVSGRNRLKDQLQLKPALLFMVLVLPGFKAQQGNDPGKSSSKHGKC